MLSKLKKEGNGNKNLQNAYLFLHFAKINCNLSIATIFTNKGYLVGEVSGIIFCSAMSKCLSIAGE